MTCKVMPGLHVAASVWEINGDKFSQLSTMKDAYMIIIDTNTYCSCLTPPATYEIHAELTWAIYYHY